MGFMVPQRRSLRLKEYDYSQTGAYFVTLDTWKHLALFGEILEDLIHLNRYGLVAKGELKYLARRFQQVQVDEYIIMPNHLHVIIWILATDSAVGARREEPKESSDLRLASPGQPTDSNFNSVEVNDMERRARLADSGEISLINDVGERRARLTESDPNSLINLASPLRGPGPGALGTIVGAYKSTTARIINGLRHTPGVPVWQRNYYEHVIRDDEELDRIRRYVQANPINWQAD
jgi:putative transposase